MRLRKEHGFEADDVILCNVSRLSWEKRPLELIDLFLQVKGKKKFKLIIVGNGPLEEELNEKIRKNGLVDAKAEIAEAEKLIKECGLHVSPKEKLRNLTVAQCQLIEIIKAISINAKVIIMDEPTRGIDVGAKREIHALLRQLAESGVGVIVVSSELPEVIGVSDRVAVMHEGCLAGFLEGEEVTEENIMKLASGEQLAEKELRQ